MLTPEETARLNWNPLRDVQKYGRPENYALSSQGYDAHGGLRYAMACGHRSLPGVTICERGCKTAPAWTQPLVRNRTLEALERFSTRDRPDTMSRSRRTQRQARASLLGAEHGYRFVPRRVA